jgi:hypothetical protein
MGVIQDSVCLVCARVGLDHNDAVPLQITRDLLQTGYVVCSQCGAVELVALPKRSAPTTDRAV